MKPFRKPILLIVLIVLVVSGCSLEPDPEEDSPANRGTRLPQNTEPGPQATPQPDEEYPIVDDQGGPPTPIPTSEHYAPSRTDAVPIGETTSAGNVEFMIAGTIRPATDLVLAASDANRKPGEGMEYVFVDLVEVCAAPIHVECFIRVSDMRLIGSSGIERRARNILGHPLMMPNRHIKGGTPAYGYVAFIVDQDETDLVFYYDPGKDGTAYLAVE